MKVEAACRDKLVPVSVVFASGELPPPRSGPGRDGTYTGGRWQVAGGRWQVAGGRWQVAGGRWQVAGGRWHHSEAG